jgi:hypothetical protein
MSDQWGRMTFKPLIGGNNSYKREIPPETEESKNLSLLEKTILQRDALQKIAQNAAFALLKIEEINKKYGLCLFSNDANESFILVSKLLKDVEHVISIENITDENKKTIHDFLFNAYNTQIENQKNCFFSSTYRFSFIYDISELDRNKLCNMSPENEGDYNISLYIKIGEGEVIAIKSWCYKNTKGKERNDFSQIEIL